MPTSALSNAIEQAPETNSTNAMHETPYNALLRIFVLRYHLSLYSCSTTGNTGLGCLGFTWCHDLALFIQGPFRMQTHLFRNRGPTCSGNSERTTDLRPQKPPESNTSTCVYRAIGRSTTFDSGQRLLYLRLLCRSQALGEVDLHLN